MYYVNEEFSVIIETTQDKLVIFIHCCKPCMKYFSLGRVYTKSNRIIQLNKLKIKKWLPKRFSHHEYSLGRII